MTWSTKLEDRLLSITSDSKTKSNGPLTLDSLFWSGILQDSNSILSIGAGRGDAELILMEKFSKMIGYIDPSGSLKDDYISKINRKKLETQLIEAIEARFEDYKIGVKYDAAIAVHSLYYVEINSDFFQKLENILNPNGRFLSILSTEKDFSKRLMKRFNPDRFMLNHEDLVHQFSEKGFFPKTKVVEIPINFSGYLDGDRLSVRGMEWVSYMLNLDKPVIEGELRAEIEHFFIRERESKASFVIGAMCSVFDC